MPKRHYVLQVHMHALLKMSKMASMSLILSLNALRKIGPRHVQFVADNASNYIVAGQLIEDKYPHIFKINCSWHCINLMFKVIDEMSNVKSIMDNDRMIAKFMHKYGSTSKCLT